MKKQPDRFRVICSVRKYDLYALMASGMNGKPYHLVTALDRFTAYSRYCIEVFAHAEGWERYHRKLVPTLITPYPRVIRRMAEGQVYINN